MENPHRSNANGVFKTPYLSEGNYLCVISDKNGRTLIEERVTIHPVTRSNVMQEYATVDDLLSDDFLAYEPGRGLKSVMAGDHITVLEGRHNYIVAPSDAVDNHLITTGMVKLFVQPEAGRFNVLAFNAPTDRVSDFSTAFDAALTAAAQENGAVFLPRLTSDRYEASYFTSQQHTVPVGVSLFMEGILQSGHTGSGAALTIGSPSTFNHRIDLDIALTRATQSDWSDENDVGVRCTRVNKSRITLRYISGFTVNAEFVGNGGGLVHNTIDLGELLNAQKQICFVAENNGWVNRNSIVGGGRLGWNSNINSTKSRYGVVVCRRNSIHEINSNVIGLFDFEPNTGSFTEAVPVVLEGATRNQITFSDDISKNTQCRFMGSSSGNMVDAIFDGNTLAKLDDLSHRGDNIYNRRQSLFRDESRSIWSSEFLPKSLVGYTANNDVCIKSHSGFDASGTPKLNISGITLTEGYLGLPQGRGVARRLFSEPGVQYVINRNIMQGFGGRIAIKCYDESGNHLPGTTEVRINDANYTAGDRVRFSASPYNLGGIVFECTTPGTTGPSEPNGLFSISDAIADGTVIWRAVREPVVTQRGVNPFYTNSFFGGCFRSGSDYESETMLLFTDVVAYADIILCGGTQPCRLRGWSISTVNGTPVSTTHPLGLEDGILYSYQSPELIGSLGNGGFTIGQKVFDSSPASGSAMGWACSASGDPGTWISMQPYA